MPLPSHLAIIMDGNGRWARARRRPRTLGHLRGAKKAREVIEACAQLGIPHLTLYAFSSENWFRPLQEVQFLMNLLIRHLRRERATLMRQNIRFRTIGEIERLSVEVRREIETTVHETSMNTGMVLTFALSYGSRQELTRAVQDIARDIASGALDVGAVDQDLVSSRLESSFLPDPDLIIRTSGESRLSNFMMWQAAYSELYITPTLWPDFGASELKEALVHYSNRERRFGRVPDPAEASSPWHPNS